MRQYACLYLYELWKGQILYWFITDPILCWRFLSYQSISVLVVHEISCTGLNVAQTYLVNPEPWSRIVYPKPCLGPSSYLPHLKLLFSSFFFLKTTYEKTCSRFKSDNNTFPLGFQSGTAFSLGAFTEKEDEMRSQAFQVGAKLGCSASESVALVDCLREQDALALVAASIEVWFFILFFFIIIKCFLNQACLISQLNYSSSPYWDNFLPLIQIEDNYRDKPVSALPSHSESDNKKKVQDHYMNR